MGMVTGDINDLPKPGDADYVGPRKARVFTLANPSGSASVEARRRRQASLLAGNGSVIAGGNTGSGGSASQPSLLGT